MRSLSFLRVGLLLLTIMLFAVAANAREFQAADEPHKRSQNFSWMSAAEWQELHEANLQARAEGPVELVFLGDSITRGWLSAGKSVWNLRYKALGTANLGISGDTTQNLLWRITVGQELEGLDPAVVVLQIGSNNFVYSGHTPGQVAAGVKAIVNEVRAQLPAASIILVGIFPRGAEAKNPLRGRIQRANEEIARLAQDEQVYYLDFGRRYLKKDGATNVLLMHDSVHLTEQGYQVWADEMQPLVNQLLINDT